MCNLDDNWMMIAGFTSQVLILCVEAWLGKTSKTKSGSILELIYNTLMRKKE